MNEEGQGSGSNKTSNRTLLAEVGASGICFTFYQIFEWIGWKYASMGSKWLGVLIAFLLAGDFLGRLFPDRFQKKIASTIFIFGVFVSLLLAYADLHPPQRPTLPQETPSPTASESTPDHYFLAPASNTPTNQYFHYQYGSSVVRALVPCEVHWLRFKNTDILKLTPTEKGPKLSGRLFTMHNDIMTDVHTNLFRVSKPQVWSANTNQPGRLSLENMQGETFTVDHPDPRTFIISGSIRLPDGSLIETVDQPEDPFLKQFGLASSTQVVRYDKQTYGGDQFFSDDGEPFVVFQIGVSTNNYTRHYLLDPLK